MLFLDPDVPATAANRALAEFFAKAHSSWALSEGLELALWSPRPVPARFLSRIEQIRSGVAMFGWKDGSRLRKGFVRFNHLEDVLSQEHEVVLARRTLPVAVTRLLEDRLGHRAVADRQIEGWFRDRQPHGVRPTGALLPPRGEDALRVGMHCVVLVEVADYWVVLSERGLRTYVFGGALADGRAVVFFPRGEEGGWSLRRAPGLEHDALRRRFGEDAAGRARPDAPALVVELTERA